MPTINVFRLLDRDEWVLLQRVQRELDLDPVLDLEDVDVSIAGNRINLSGSVPGVTTRARIERTVARIAGVNEIDNQLTVFGWQVSLGVQP